jgi:hypothetical protein
MVCSTLGGRRIIFIEKPEGTDYNKDRQYSKTA